MALSVRLVTDATEAAALTFTSSPNQKAPRGSLASLMPPFPGRVDRVRMALAGRLYVVFEQNDAIAGAEVTAEGRIMWFWICTDTLNKARQIALELLPRILADRGACYGLSCDKQLEDMLLAVAGSRGLRDPDGVIRWVG